MTSQQDADRWYAMIDSLNYILRRLPEPWLDVELLNEAYRYAFGRPLSLRQLGFYTLPGMLIAMSERGLLRTRRERGRLEVALFENSLAAKWLPKRSD